VDRAYENEDDPWLKPDIQMHLNSEDRLDELLENADDDNVNPFYVREVALGPAVFLEGQARLDYWTRVLQVLARFGHHIRRLSVDFKDQNNEALLDDNPFLDFDFLDEEQVFEFEDTLITMLRSTRHVRNLKIVGARLVHDNRLEDLRRYFIANSNQLPELPELKYLSLESHCVKWTGPLLSKLVPDPAQLQALSLKSVHGWYSEPSEDVAVALGTFNNLKQLKIGRVSEEVSEYFGAIAASPQPPLETIELRTPIDVTTAFKSMVQQLNQFRDSLKHLTLKVRGIHYPGLQPERFLPGARVRLPNLTSMDLDIAEKVLPIVSTLDGPLKKLTLRLWTNTHPFNFRGFYSNLARFGATLEELNVKIGYERGIRMNGEVD